MKINRSAVLCLLSLALVFTAFLTEPETEDREVAASTVEAEVSETTE